MFNNQKKKLKIRLCWVSNLKNSLSFLGKKNMFDNGKTKNNFLLLKIENNFTFLTIKNNIF